MNWLLILPPIWAWIVLEVVLSVRDVVRRKGSIANDRGTRIAITFGLIVAYGAAVVAALLVRQQEWLALGGWHLITGEVIAWAGLGIRIWSIVVLGRSFRLTVEVDSDQAIVDRGPYRWVRHPSYTGLLILAIGFGIALGNWVSLVILIVLPPIVILRRIRVEEAQLIAVLGQPYVDYSKRTKRLVPGVW
ncbi:MAG TPA: isoprenylcysteine carboxylmethyltransferase family protein [Galbitalea sp.]|jgi:protein-S-isoprenylcysteine O-methyltransferase Ste14|nr:isoprenylcysteine carboxylmethyltransferase family protein [Galbitalea sp.]